MPVSPRVSTAAASQSPGKPVTAASIEKAIKVHPPLHVLNQPPPPPHPPSSLIFPLSFAAESCAGQCSGHQRAAAAASQAAISAAHAQREEHVNATPSHLSRALCQYRHCTRSQVTVCRRLQNPRMEGSPSSAAAAAVQPAFNARGGSSKEKGKTLLVIDAAAAAAAAASAASAEFEAAKVAVGKLKAKALVEVCQLKHAPPAVRQLLHAACAALGERVWQCVCVYGGGGGG
jgi:hypothetical protein